MANEDKISFEKIYLQALTEAILKRMGLNPGDKLVLQVPTMGRNVTIDPFKENSKEEDKQYDTE